MLKFAGYYFSLKKNLLLEYPLTGAGILIEAIL
jgi:hypothetical protein